MLDRGGINNLIRLIHTIVNEKFLHFSRGSGGTGTPPVPPETMKNHPLDPDPGPHTGTLPEDEVVLDDAEGHDHQGAGDTGKKVTAAKVVNVPAGGIAATNVQAAIDELDGEKVGIPLTEADVEFDDATGHDHQGAGDTGKKVDTKDLADTEGQLLTGAQKTGLTDGGATVLHAHAGEVTDAVKVTLTNQTGSERSANDVVVTDPDHDESFIGTSGSGHQGKVLVVAETIPSSGSGGCWERGGPFNINVVGAVDRDDGLRTSATIYKAEAAPSVISTGVFAIALSTSGSGGGTVKALFLDAIGGGGDGGGDGADVKLTRVATGISFGVADTNVALDTELGQTDQDYVSSEFDASYIAEKAIDGGAGEWASKGDGINAWIQINFDRAVLLSKIVLYDRPNPTDNWGAGEIEFSDLSTVAFTAPPTGGGAKEINLDPAKSTTYIKITQTSGGGGSNRGFKEIAAYEVADSLAVTGVIGKQDIKIYDNGDVLKLTRTVDWWESYALVDVSGLDLALNGYLTITEADGSTLLATSPTYGDIDKGDLFALEIT